MLAQQLGSAPQRAGTDARALGQITQHRAGPAHQHIARVVARQHAADHEAGRQRRLHVLQRMHGEIDAPVEERLLDLFREQPLATDLRELSV